MTRYYPNTRIVIFAKAPIAGLCKTRMQPQLSPAQSAKLQAKLTWYICQIAQQSQLSDVELWCTPDIQHPLFSSIQNQLGIALQQQHGSDLGERIWHCLQQKPEYTTLILGTDCPYLEAKHLQGLIQVVHSGEYNIAIIPAFDGGYTALSCQAAPPALFDNISWSSDKVYAQTINIAKQNRLKIKVLEALSDVDTHDDYVEMCKLLPNFVI